MNKIQITLTKLYLKVYGLKFKGVKEYALPNNKNVEIITFEGDFFSEGQATFFKTIIVNESIFSDYSKPVQDYIVTHELGHVRFPRIVYLILYPILFISLILELISFVFLIFFIILSIFNPYFVFHVVAGIIIFLPSLIITWSWEIVAEFYAIGLLGLDNVILAQEKGKIKKVKSSIYKKIINRLTHPFDRLVFCLYNLIKKS